MKNDPLEDLPTIAPARVREIEAMVADRAAKVKYKGADIEAGESLEESISWGFGVEIHGLPAEEQAYAVTLLRIAVISHAEAHLPAGVPYFIANSTEKKGWKVVSRWSYAHNYRIAGA